MRVIWITTAAVPKTNTNITTWLAPENFIPALLLLARHASREQIRGTTPRETRNSASGCRRERARTGLPSMPLCHGSLTKYNDGPLRPLQVPFKSRVPQRGKELEISPELGPGTYKPKPGYGCPSAAAAIIDPLRQGSAFASKSKKVELKKGVAADVDFPPAHVVRPHVVSPPRRRNMRTHQQASG